MSAIQSLLPFGSLLPALPNGQIHPVVKIALRKQEAQQRLVQSFFDELSGAQSDLATVLAENKQLKQERISIHKAQESNTTFEQLQINRLQSRINTLVSEINQLEQTIRAILARPKKTEVKNIVQMTKEALIEYYDHTHEVAFISPSDRTTTSIANCDTFGPATGVTWFPRTFAEVSKEFYEC